MARTGIRTSCGCPDMTNNPSRGQIRGHLSPGSGPTYCRFIDTGTS